MQNMTEVVHVEVIKKGYWELNDSLINLCPIPTSTFFDGLAGGVGN